MDKNGNIWLGLQDGKLITFSSTEVTKPTSIRKTIQPITVTNTNFTIKSIIESGPYILVAGNDSQIIRIKKDSNNYIIDNPIVLKEIDQVYCMIILKNNLFIGTENGVFQIKNVDYIDKQKPILLDTIWRLKGSIIRSISVHNNNLWIGSEGEGLYKYNSSGKELEHFLYLENKKNAINSNYVLNTLVDSNENLWIGTWFGGINILDLNENNFKFIYDSQSEVDLFSNIVWAISKTMEGVYYLGTHGNGLCKYSLKDKSFVSILKTPELKSISTLYYDELLKLLFIGTWENGVKVFDPIKGKLVTNEFDFSILSKERIYTITKGPDGNLWIGSFNKGLFSFSFKENKLEKFQLSADEGLNNTDIRCLLTDNNNKRLWIGSIKNGLFTIEFTNKNKEKRITHFPKFKDPIKKINAENLFQDSNCNIWILCRNGIGKVEPNSLPVKLPILNGAITTGMVEDAKNQLWISTYNGIYIYNPKTQKITPLLPNYTFSDILFIPESELVLVASDNGLLKASAIQPNEQLNSPNISFSHLKILDKLIKPLDKYKGVRVLPKNLNYCDSLILPYFSQTFSIGLNAISFIGNTKEKLRYRLHNFESGWNLSHDRSATASYTNVPPGNYKFEVQASNSKGEWGGNIRTLTIIKEQPWWTTSLAYLVYFIILTLIIYIIYREIRDRVRMRQELKIEKIKQEREFEIYQQKMSFFTNVSHDIRTPLTLILGPLEEILNNYNIEKAVELKLQRMLKNSRMLLSLVNQILDFRKAESDNIKLNLKQIDLNSFVQNVHYQFSELAQNKEIDLDISSPDEKIWVVADPQKLESIFFNLISNAIKFTPKYGQIMIHFNMDKDFITIIVKDTGMGIPEDELESIFTRFYRSKNNSQLQGTGIGVALVKKYIELHKGNIEVKSTKNIGSEFIIQLPVLPDTHSYPNHIALMGNENNSLITLTNSKSDTKKATVLVIDDSYDIREYLKEILQKDYNFLEADNGKLGLSITNKRLPDLVISDIMMDGMDGIEVCGLIKTNLNTSHIPVILLTAKNSMDSKIEGFEKGSDAYLEKPFNSKLLLTMIKKLIEHRELLKKKFLLSTSIAEETTPTTVDEEFIEKVIKIIHKHLAESEFSVQSLADKLKMSQDQIYRKIRALTGLSAIHFIRLIRLKQAASLLAQKRYAVNEIVYMVGFNNPSYFTRCFKAEFGVPPSDYGQKNDVRLE
ncbi:ATP-binding protein [Cellulophaga sp. F20128]|uniref:hybrid sensor histidine kinase/response regulator transcription factor n=1 Tax=Cellulophaga sp. F20128 TaxID=2926413 RepID=UPI001FF4AC82|nr:hybrid sensor histidine kinase/response regulator transcription factor [Cellulophaga sp. F20128]MCK0158266.1 ATP-binding protein [Cellulophaga sp. F20128]